jgi:type II secretory pathway predicted ATPase ExeA
MPSTSGVNVVSQMLAFYSLREHPFGVSPDPRFLYPSQQHREALASLIFGIESQVGFAALIAEPGSGKTTLLFDILQRYRERAKTAFVFNTQCSGLELLRQVVLELEVPGTESETDPVRLYQQFTSFIAQQMSAKPVVIIIDEAQNLENSALETLRLLSNFEAADRKLLHIILAGQPQLAEKLRHPSLIQLLQRITMISQLERFTQEQTQECIVHRLKVAGYKGSGLFTEQALSRITEASGGVPREINRICMNAMQLGFGLREKLIGVDVVEEVLSDLTLARWAPETEAQPSELEAPKVQIRPPSFRVGGRSTPRPMPEHVPFADPDDVDPLLYLRDPSSTRARARAPRSSPEDQPPHSSEDDVDPLRLRRALLDAAVRRRRAAELRLMGLQRDEGQEPANSAIYPYKFAMGCVPSPGEEEEASQKDEQQFRDATGRAQDSPAQIDSARRDTKGKKTGS